MRWPKSARCSGSGCRAWEVLRHQGAANRLCPPHEIKQDKDWHWSWKGWPVEVTAGTRNCPETRRSDLEGLPWETPAINMKTLHFLLYATICLLLYHGHHCCILPFSEIKLIISAMYHFSFHLFPLGNWVLPVQICSLPTWLPSPCCFPFSLPVPSKASTAPFPSPGPAAAHLAGPEDPKELNKEHLPLENRNGNVL